MKSAPRQQAIVQYDPVQRELDKTQLREELVSLNERLKELCQIWGVVREGEVGSWEPQRQAAYWRARSTICQLKIGFRKLLAAYCRLLPAPPEPRILEVVYDLGEHNEIGYLETVPRGGIR